MHLKVKKSAVSAAPSAPATTPASPTQIEHPSHFAPPSPDLPRGIPHPPYLSIPYQNNHYASVRPHAYPATSSPVLPPHYAYYDPRPSLHYSPHAHHPPTHLGPPQHHAPHHHARHPHQLHSPYSPPMQYSAYPSDYEHSRYERAPRRYSPYPAPQVFRPPPSPAWRNRMSRGPSEYNEGMDVDAGYFPPAPQPGYASAPSHRPRSVSKPPPFSQAEDVDMDDGEPELSGRRRSSLPADFLRAQLPPPGSAAFAGDLSAGQSKEAMEIEVVESGREPVREQEQLPCESAPPASRTERRPRAASNPMPTDRTISDAEITAVQVLEELTGGKRAMLPQQQAPPQQGFPSAPSQPAQMRGYPAHQHQQPQGRYHAQGYPPYPTPSTPGYGYRAPPASAGRPPSGTGYAGHPPRPPTPVQAKPRPVVNVPAPSQQPERRVRYVPIPPTTSQPAHGHQSGRSKMLEKRRLAHKRGASTGSIATEVKELAAAAAARKLAIEEERGRSRTPVDELLERSPVKPRGQRAMSAPHVVEDHRYGLACVEREMRRSQRALFAEINPTPESRARAAKEAARMAVERFPYAAPTMAPEVERIVQVGELIPGRDRGRNEMQALMHEIIGVPGVRRGRNHHVDIEPLGGIVQPGARKRSGRATP